MDRRTFNTGFISGAVVAALPITGVSMAASGSGTGPLYSWAVAIARAQNRASPEMLARQLRIVEARLGKTASVAFNDLKRVVDKVVEEDAPEEGTSVGQAT